MRFPNPLGVNLAEGDPDLEHAINQAVFGLHGGPGICLDGWVSGVLDGVATLELAVINSDNEVISVAA